MLRVIVVAVAAGIGLSFFRERARAERMATMTPSGGAVASTPGSGEPDSSARRGPGWLPDGPWFLVALALVGLAFLGFGFAETLPVDERGRPVGIAAAAGAVVALGLSVRRPRDGFLRRWRATTVVFVVMAAVAALLSGLGGFGLALLTMAIIGFGGLASIFVVTVGLAERRTRLDALLASALVAAAFATFVVADLAALRLESSAGERLGDEADALRSDATVAEKYPGAPSPILVVGTDRRLVAWQLPSFSIGPDVRLLVHDPDGLLAVRPSPDEMLPGGMRECDRITGPWWDCSYG